MITIISISNTIAISTIAATIIASSTTIAIKQNNQNDCNNCNNQNKTCYSAMPKNVVDQMNYALVQNMDILDKQAIHIQYE
jgi:hypothetical protein